MVDIATIEKLTLKYVSRYNKTKYCIKEYLLRKLPDAKTNNDLLNLIEDTLNKFENKGYINDLNYSIFKINSKIKSGKSVNYIKNYLFEKHISKENTTKAFAEVTCNENIEKLDKIAIIKLCQSKRIGPWGKEQDKDKNFKKLSQRGFLYSSIEYVLNNNTETLSNKLKQLENKLSIF